jgi:hypothetical protein
MRASVPPAPRLGASVRPLVAGPPKRDCSDGGGEAPTNPITVTRCAAAPCRMRGPRRRAAERGRHTPARGRVRRCVRPPPGRDAYQEEEHFQSAAALVGVGGSWRNRPEIRQAEQRRKTPRTMRSHAHGPQDGRVPQRERSALSYVGRTIVNVAAPGATGAATLAGPPPGRRRRRRAVSARSGQGCPDAERDAGDDAAIPPARTAEWHGTGRRCPIGPWL